MYIKTGSPWLALHTSKSAFYFVASRNGPLKYQTALHC